MTESTEKKSSLPSYDGQDETGTYSYAYDENTNVRVEVKNTSKPGERSVVREFYVPGSDMVIRHEDFGRWGGKSNYQVGGKTGWGLNVEFRHLDNAIDYVLKNKKDAKMK